jgi:hypothetical protein
MARYRRHRKGHRASKKLSITGLAPVAFIATEAYGGYKANGPSGALNNAIGFTTGYNIAGKKFEPENLIPLASILIAGYAVRKVGNRVSKNPFMGLPLRW